MKNRRRRLTENQRYTIWTAAEFLASVILWWNVAREMILAMPI